MQEFLKPRFQFEHLEYKPNQVSCHVNKNLKYIQR
jgi:hypothetical protein